MNYHLRHLFEYDRSRSQAGFGSKLELRLQRENITKDELWDQMENADPTPNKQYVGWLIKAFQEGSEIEDLVSIGTNNLIIYEFLKKKKLLKPEHIDIGRFRTLTDLEDAMDYYDIPEKKLIDRGNYKEVFRTSTVRILEIFDLTAACYYGQGTKWCTIADEDNKFFYYIKKGPIFIILPLKPTYDGEKYQFWYNEKKFGDYELVDEIDADFYYSDLKLKIPDVIEFFNDLILERIPENELHKFIKFLKNPSEEIQLKAIERNVLLIRDIKNPTEQAQLLVISKNGYLIKYIENPTEKVQLTALKQNVDVIKNIENPTEAVQQFVVEKIPELIYYIKNPTEKIQLIAVSKAGTVIANIKNPSEKVQLAAVRENGIAIAHINNPSETMQLIAVNQNGHAVQFIENPSEDVQLAAVRQKKNSINFIENPTEKVIELSKK